ncbi:MAG TPA: hypothetical protein VF683_10270, partial [Chthoniobacterales bacterium]
AAFGAVVFTAARLLSRLARRCDDPFLRVYFLAAFIWLLTQVFGNLAAVWLNPSSFVARFLWISLGVAVAVARLQPSPAKRRVQPRVIPSEPQLLHA